MQIKATCKLSERCAAPACALAGGGQIAGRGNIQGTAPNTSGAVIPNAAVTLTDQAALAKRTTKSDASGGYGFPALRQGTSSARSLETLTGKEFSH
ncbi:MAG: carboxypeptidase-like regulatory domain-containing protein [Terracidiphilus sp.]